MRPSAVAVEAVGDGVDDRHRPGQGELELALRVRTRETRLGCVDAARQAQRPDHLRHHRVVAVVADAHLDLVLEVDALDLLQKAVHEVLARLLAVADDVEAGVFLRLDPEQRRVGLGARELGTARLPVRPELVGFGEPGRLGQAAGDGGFEHRCDPLHAAGFGRAGGRAAARRCATVVLVTAADALVANSATPVPASERIAALDVLRGFALLGIFIMNMPGFSHSLFAAPAMPSGIDMCS